MLTLQIGLNSEKRYARLMNEIKNDAEQYDDRLYPTSRLLPIQRRPVKRWAMTWSTSD